MRTNIVLDTNTIMSALLFPKSITRQAYDKALDHFQIVSSEKCYSELLEVATRPKFDKYFPFEYRVYFINAFCSKSLFIEPSETITDCRDPKDNKFLELAVAANAPIIVTGDLDLLVLNPFRNINILKSGDFLAFELA